MATRHVQQVVCAADEPRENAAHPYSEELAERLAVTQGTHHSQGGEDERLGSPAVEHPSNVPGEHPRFPQGVLREAGVRSAVRRRDGRTIAQCPDFRVAAAPHGPIDHNVSTLALLDGQLGYYGAGDD